MCHHNLFILLLLLLLFRLFLILVFDHSEFSTHHYWTAHVYKVLSNQKL
jgi:hypothetical protein